MLHNPDRGKLLGDVGSLAQREVLSALSEQLSMRPVPLDGPPPVAGEGHGAAIRDPGQVEVFVTIGTARSQPGVTMWVR